jgi:predicted protein tyrosine phosphatase
MDIPEILATYGTQNKDEEKQNKNTTQHVLDTIIHKQTQITLIRHGGSNKHLEVKMNRIEEEKQKHNTICVGYHYTQTNTNNINKT